jgi:hypothetical protein
MLDCFETRYQVPRIQTTAILLPFHGSFDACPSAPWPLQSRCRVDALAREPPQTSTACFTEVAVPEALTERPALDSHVQYLFW